MDAMIVNYLPAVILLVILAVQLCNRAFLAARIRYFFWVSALIILALLVYQSGSQYFGWLSAGPPASYLLPPASPISYYLLYILTHFWLPYLLSLAFAGIAFLGAKYLNKKYNERFFYPEEYYLIALGIFLSVHPFWIGFLIITALGYLCFAVLAALIQGNGARASFYYLWLPAALLVSLLTPWLMTFPFLSILKL